MRHPRNKKFKKKRKLKIEKEEDKTKIDNSQKSFPIENGREVEI